MKKGLFKKILVVMMCIALTLGMAACGSKKVKVGTGEKPIFRRHGKRQQEC